MKKITSLFIIILILFTMIFISCKKRPKLEKAKNLTFYKNWEWGWEVNDEHIGNVIRLIILENDTYVLFNMKTKKKSAGMLKIKESNYYELIPVEGDEINDILPYASTGKGRLRYDGVLILDSDNPDKKDFEFKTAEKAMGFDN